VFCGQIGRFIEKEGILLLKGFGFWRLKRKFPIS